jgi:hypothetical protein
MNLVNASKKCPVQLCRIMSAIEFFKNKFPFEIPDDICGPQHPALSFLKNKKYA